ncbi:hypothetical protein A3A36_00120 [Candidatus Kaiserbacteria bacterium RIFCSPLOWO2_01_FULL_52_12b]|uniref:Uncharacterized protein n=1 Tax=Candidatus Kaiserbacteria bacterium RIFCSPLOWO2_01_FULL_52_12b TaxID=1798509 RepID=A0A1F6EXA5_9BACT|nr:MAG: hypothetical protein A3A36_00120 [Candidatus Kaiserbacteria bacterium RIFCSPLOWO2_01_FULL_52_12b]
MADLLHLIFWVFVFILGLSFFGISIQAIVNSPAGQENFAYLADLLSQTWQWFTNLGQYFTNFNVW